MAVTREGRNLLAVGLLSQSRVVNVRGWPRENGEYQLHLDTRTPLQTKIFRDALYIDTAPARLVCHYCELRSKRWMNG